MLTGDSPSCPSVPAKGLTEWLWNLDSKSATPYFLRKGVFGCLFPLFKIQLSFLNEFLACQSWSSFLGAT